MEPSKEFLEFAKECDRLAQEADTKRHRRILKKMAEAWRKVAEEESRRPSLWLAKLMFLTSAALDFGILRQPQPHMGHMVESGSGSRHSQAAGQLQTFSGVTPILFWLCYQGGAPTRASSPATQTPCKSSRVTETNELYLPAMTVDSPVVDIKQDCPVEGRHDCPLRKGKAARR